ncbi:MAG: hypothetical protein AMXMBFR42_15250 [Burkholderiales bacterium]
MIMPPTRYTIGARNACRLALGLLSSCLAFAQAPAPSSPAEAPAAPRSPSEAKGAAKDAAAPSAPSDAAKSGARGAARAAPSQRSSAPPAVPATPPEGPLGPLAWLSGCWWGEVNRHEFREYWHPLRGDMMVGVSRLAYPDKVISYEYLRLEQRPDGVYYVAAPKGKPEAAFKLTSTTKDKERGDDLFDFTVAGNDFPSRITYRRGSEGWLYVEVAGTAQGKEHKVIYPFRRVDCESGELVRK